ncbi:MAG TPA: xanthine dehydrogenase family protein subunit M [Acidimicrobiales bacterium]|nr:xanthine dehydrogenase family protein subunit M [Acidimicrobiales bacterium]
MKPAPFDYVAPTTVEESVAALADGSGDAKVLAGGQSLVPILALRLSRFDRLVDLGRVASLRGVSRRNGTLTVGAMTRQADVEHDPAVAEAAPLLARAVPFIGHFQIRNRGTVGGSIAHADPAAELPAVALALDADLEVAGPDGTRTVAARDFFVSMFMTALDDAEVLTAVHLPVWGPGSGFALREAARRHGDFALAGVACGVRVTDGRVDKAAIGLFGMGSTPLRGHAAEDAMVGVAPADLDLDELGRLVVADTGPPDDVHASASYRKATAARLAAAALRTAIEEATRG